MSGVIKLSGIRGEIIRILEREESTYARPVKSEDIGSILNVSASYVREITKELQALGLVGARRGRGGGYYLKSQGNGMAWGRARDREAGGR